NMSYEFRTPLTSISGFADLLKAGIAGELNPKAMEYVEAISASADRLSQQINTVLDYSQGQVGALPIAKAPVDVMPLLQRLVADHSDYAAEQGIVLRLDAAANPGTISADEGRLRQAIGHVVDNAIRYGRAGGNVLIVTQNEKAAAVIIVSDDGPGITSKDQTAVFDGFGRSQVGVKSAGRTTAKDNGGADGVPGLGLPLARQLIESHDGTLELHSEIGLGTSVIIRLPR
nr:HAMP domain-containing histidine kinase [Sphingorhabdus sp.]